ncbi:MAG: DUF3352 domain-containing protein [Nocardioides sp.]|nr:DUF3352 domain-containing protein [Nocardioides sp.]
MSSNLPPSQPPYGSQPPSQPPFGSQPPQGPPAPELLDAQGGTALGAPPRSGSGGRKGLLIGGGVVARALVGGGAWAAMSFVSTGAQPAEALPASTLGYVSVDLDPSGGQKIEALQTLNKFPKFQDSVGVDSDDDLRQRIFDLVQEDDTCTDLDFAQDVDPWLGNRAAVAAVEDADGAPQPVVVIQVTDADAAEAGLEAIKACGADEDAASGEDTGWVVEGDWAVVAPTEELARSVSDDAAEAHLADDATYQKWTGETGAAGVMTMYAAPAAAASALEELGDSEGLPDQARRQLEDFKGFAATVRFTDGSLELEAAGSAPADAAGVLGGSSVSEQVATLPDDTAAAFGISLDEGWGDGALDQLAGALGAEMSAEDLVAEFETATGLSVPADIEVLTSGGVVVAVGPGLDVEELANSADPSQVPVALKLSGDADAINEVVATLAAQVPGEADVVESTTEGDTVVLGPDAAYRAEVAAGGNLGDTEDFSRVVPDAESPVVCYLNVNAFESSLETVLAGSEGAEQVQANIEPLSSIGISTSNEGDVSRFVLRVGTDD